MSTTRSLEKQGSEKIHVDDKSITTNLQPSQEPLTKEELQYINTSVVPQKWYQWFSESDSKQEKKLIIKLDLIIWVYLFLSSFVKTLDSTAVGYAYVSGMKEDLKMYGNQLTYQSSCYMAGFIVGQIPLTMLATKLPINLYLPIMDSLWSIFTLGMFKITNYHQLYALRFCIGLLGSFFFPTVQYILGSWYTKSEITKRSALFFCASQIGSMAGGYIQASAFESLDGVHGLKGWQWLYLLAFIITIPISLYGIFTLPGLPEHGNSTTVKILSDEELRLAQLRMLREGRSSNDKLDLATIKKTILGSWRFGMLVVFAIFFSQADGISSNSGLPIWLKENNYSVPQTNTITTVIPAVTIVTAIVNGIIVDTWQTSHPIVIAVTTVLNMVAGIILVVWHNVSRGGILFAFFLSGTADGIAAVLYSWANIICSSNSSERALTLATMNTLGNTFSVWVPLFVWKTEDAPRYLKGYSYNVALCAMMLILLFPLTYLWRRESKSKTIQSDTELE
ncbi:probable transporter Seo1p [[Candida] anglica]|uniref:Probable transporter Seo1p n=1 Tax=[Candida] anglica TaxID=148631 RepID=A0ABP0ECC7_9ASCO